MLHFGDMEACEYNARYGREKKLLSKWTGTHDEDHDDFYVAMYFDSTLKQIVIAPQSANNNVRIFDFGFEARVYYKMLLGILIDNDFYDYLGEPSNEECYTRAITECDMFFATSKEYEVEGVTK